MKRHAAELEMDMQEISNGSDEYDPTGKKPEQLIAMIAKHHRDVKTSRMEVNLRCALDGTE